MKYLFLLVLTFNSYADCFNDEFDYQLIVKGEVTSEDQQSIKDYCDYGIIKDEEIEDDELEDEENR